ncbi:MAG: hypothetical protein FWG05_04880, partial [Kiritimatiellaeota bacterium]|nr:hypothetical protein [Kiritimatiellota bacterium]
FAVDPTEYEEYDLTVEKTILPAGASFIRAGLSGSYRADSKIVWFTELRVGTSWWDVAPFAGINTPSLAFDPATSNFTVSASFITGGTEFDLFAAANAGEFGGDTPDSWDASVLLSDNVTDEVIYDAALPGLAPDTMYRYGAVATNGTMAFSQTGAETFLTGEVWVEKISDADEYGLEPGYFKFCRPANDEAKTLPLTVYYSVAGTAEEGVDYVAGALPGVIVIPADADAATIQINPIVNAAITQPTSIILTVEQGLYYLPQQNGATMNIAKWDPSTAPQNIWVATGSLPNASIAANWSKGVPTAGQDILLNVFSSADMLWDVGAFGLPDTVKSWTQTEDYKGTVTFLTTYPEYDTTFTNFTVTGDVVIEGGKWTHPANNDLEAYRLRVSAGSDFTLGAAAKIDLQFKGYAATKTPHGTNIGLGIHGGGRGSFDHVYGDVYEPVNLGAGGQSHAGGGALYFTINGDALIEGEINANSFQTTDVWSGPRSGAGGSIYIRASSIGGTTGLIQANGCSAANSEASSGGRIALFAANSQTIEFPLANVYARGNSGGEYMSAGAGTVLLKTMTQEYGTLLVDNSCMSYTGHPQFFPSVYGTTCVPPNKTWTFDSIITRRFGMLSIPPNSTLVLPNGFGSVSSTDSFTVGSELDFGDGIMYLGGDIVLGGEQPYIFQNNWKFHAAVPYTINGDVIVTNGGAFGCLPLRNTLDNFTRCEIIINGNLHVDSTSRITAVRAGVDFDVNNQNRVPAHGGQAGQMTEMRTYGSILNPTHPGIFGSSYTSVQRDNRGIGSGSVTLRVNGEFRLDGHFDVSARDAHGIYYDYSGGAAGSVNITAETLVGEGLIEASGYRYVNDGKYGGAAGRVAVRLTGAGATFDDFGENKIRAYGFSENDSGRANRMTSAGTVYLETVANGANGGVVKIYNGGNPNNNLAFTPFPSFDYGGSNDVFTAASLDIGQCARVKLFNSVRMTCLEIADGCLFDLNGETLTVREAKIGGASVGMGTYGADSYLGAAGFLTDTSEFQDGILKVLGSMTIFIIR